MAGNVKANQAKPPNYAEFEVLINQGVTMDRKSFLKKSILGGIGLAAGVHGKSSLLTSNHLPFNRFKEEKKMKTVFHEAKTRGLADHGWLKSNHTFSFANYYNAERMHFGKLRVLNDDQVAPGQGFGTHPHENMEIISIPLEGDLVHKDSMNNEAIIRKGDVQVMSAGTGIFHSEYNYSHENDVKFLQIWVLPDKKGVKPRYDQISIREIQKENAFYQILSPNAEDEGVWGASKRLVSFRRFQSRDILRVYHERQRQWALRICVEWSV